MWRGLLLSAAAALFAARVHVHAEELNVHIIPHSHCDPGWLESFEGYYNSQVHSILSSVTRELQQDESRRFIWAESSFLLRWYEVQSDDTKAAFQKLVRTGQLEFVGGGWVQNDEAASPYEGIVAQQTEGHEYLLGLFGAKPRIAWSIDPFGSSAANAALAAAAGYDGLVINRVDFSVKDALKSRSAMEFVWKPYATHPTLADEEARRQQRASGSDDDGLGGAQLRSPGAVLSYSNASIYTHVLHTHYSAPRGYDFENPEGIAIGDFNVDGRASGLVRELRQRARAYRTTHLLVPFGDDFKFQDAGRQFSNMDKLINYINGKSGRSSWTDPTEGTSGTAANPEFAGVHIRYSTVSEYFDAVMDELRAQKPGMAVEGRTAEQASTTSTTDLAVPVPVYTPRSFFDGGADFFPYADNMHSWWVGYYVSRPQLKQAIRRTTQLLRAADALLALVRPWASTWQSRAAALLESEDGASAAAGSVSGYVAFSWMRAFQRVEQVRLDTALCLHHDAVTGTSRDNVVEDYTRRMTEGYSDVLGIIADAASLALGGLHKRLQSVQDGPAQGLLGRTLRTTLSPAPLTQVPHVLPVLDSIALVPAGSSQTGEDVIALAPGTPAHPVVAYNPSGWSRTVVITVMVDVGSTVEAQAGDCGMRRWPVGIVTDADGQPVPAQWLASVEHKNAADEIAARRKSSGTGVSRGVNGRDLADAVTTEDEEAKSRNADGNVAAPTWSWLSTSTRYEIAFSARLPPLSLSTYFVSVAWKAEGDAAADACGSSTVAPEVADLVAREATTTVLLPDGKVTSGSSNGGSDVPRVTFAAADKDVPVVLENACIKVEVNPLTGLIEAMTYKQTADAARVEVKQSFAAYHTRESGAYIFRPVDYPVRWVQNSGEVTVSVSTTADEAASPNLIQTVRVAGNKFSQTLRLASTLSSSGDLDSRRLAEACSDPSIPDGQLEVIPTIHAGGNEEVVMQLDTDLNVADNSVWTNMRDNIRKNGMEARAAEGGNGQSADDAETCEGDGAPRGWWTSDGLGLLRRTPAPASARPETHQQHYYPLNSASRLSGFTSSNTRAWLSVYSQQPFGVMAKVRGEDKVEGSHMEIMLHRHLMQDDGRGLSTGVYDNTVLHPRLLITVAAGGGAAVRRTTTADGSRCAAHDDWLWKWATRSILHLQPVVVLHADLDHFSAASADADGDKPQRRHVPPPFEEANALVRNPAVVLAEPAVTRFAWTAAFSTTWNGLTPTGSGAGLPPWLHLLTLQARDAVTDDVVMRFQNVGGPTVSVDVAETFASPASLLPLRLTSLRPRSLTLNHHESFMAGDGAVLDAEDASLVRRGSGQHKHRDAVTGRLFESVVEAIKDYPLASADLYTVMRAEEEEVRKDLAHALLYVKSPHGASLLSPQERDSNEFKSQNTAEEGVFISDAALHKQQQDERNKQEQQQQQQQQQEEQQPQSLPEQAEQEPPRPPPIPARRDAPPPPPRRMAGRLSADEQQPQDAPLAPEALSRPGLVGRERMRDEAPRDRRPPPGVARPEQRGPEQRGPPQGGRRLLALDDSPATSGSGTTVTLPPASIRSFVATFTDIYDGEVLEAIGTTGGASEAGRGTADSEGQGSSPQEAVGSDTAAEQGARSTQEEPQQQPTTRDSDRLGMLPQQDDREVLLDLIAFVRLASREKARMSAVLQSGGKLSAEDIGTLRALSRQPNRPHQQPMPTGLAVAVERVLGVKDSEGGLENDGKPARGRGGRRRDSDAADATAGPRHGPPGKQGNPKHLPTVTPTPLPAMPQDPWSVFAARDGSGRKQRLPRRDSDGEAIPVDLGTAEQAAWFSSISWLAGIFLGGMAVVACAVCVLCAAWLGCGRRGPAGSKGAGRHAGSLLPTTSSGAATPKSAASSSGGGWLSFSASSVKKAVNPAKVL